MNYFVFSKIMFILLFSMSVSACKVKTKSEASHSPQEVLIKFKAGTSVQAMDSLVSEFGLKKVKDIKNLNIIVFKITSKLSLEEVLQKCKQSPIIEYAEPNQSYHLDSH